MSDYDLSEFTAAALRDEIRHLRTALAAAEAERDRQYDFAVQQIARNAKLEAENERLRAGAVPEGWRLVPEELTEAMERAAYTAQYMAVAGTDQDVLNVPALVDQAMADPIQRQISRNAYRAMLAAAPEAPGEAASGNHVRPDVHVPGGDG